MYVRFMLGGDFVMCVSAKKTLSLALSRSIVWINILSRKLGMFLLLMCVHVLCIYIPIRHK